MGRGGMASMMAGMMGMLGDQIFVNGSVQFSRSVERRAHRLRLLNASNTRTLKLAWNDGTPLTVIDSDGGLLAAPLQRNYGKELGSDTNFAAVHRTAPSGRAVG